MAAADTLTTLNGLTKERYAQNVVNVVPDQDKVLKMTKFSQKDRIGAHYNQPVILSNEQGITFGNSSSTLPLSLNNSVAMTMQNAQLQSMFFALRGQIGVDAIIRTASKDQAVEDALELLVTNMVESETAYIESELLYGSVGIGSTGTAAFTNNSATSETVPVQDMAAGLFSGKENASIQFYNGASLVSSGADSVFTITGISYNATTPSSSTITVTGTSSGITTLNGLSGTNLTIFWNGANGIEFPGIAAVASAGTSPITTLYGITCSSYSLWNGNAFSCNSAPLTFGKVQEGVGVAVSKGLMGKAHLLVSPPTWANLLNDQAGLRRYTGDGSAKFSNGAEEIEYSSSNGALVIVPHPYVKTNQAHLVPDLATRWKRIGSVELAFNPGVEDPDKYFVMLQNSLGYETRLVSDTSLFIETAPARCVQFSSITNTTN
jgi:hypothetical protein